jgi:hypothetical protein
VIVVPPALVATAPLVVWERQRPRASVLAAVALTGWAVLGVALLGLYFLPSALLLLVGYVRSGNRRTRPE